MNHKRWSIICTNALIALIALYSHAVFAHDPVFGLGPHVLFKAGMELALEVAQEESGEEKESDIALDIVFGITGDWAAGVEIPFAFKEDGKETSSGPSDIQLFTKYRFWRQDSLGLQESAAVALVINTQNGDERAKPPLGNGATDVVAGLAYGYESIKWYRWASARYILPGENVAGFQKGDKWLIDFVAGWRPVPPEYKKPDTVWLLEFNGEFTNKTEKPDRSLNPNSGGSEWFISPGIFWTTRNFAIKAGLQIPFRSDLNGKQDGTDYHFKASFEWHK